MSTNKRLDEVHYSKLKSCKGSINIMKGEKVYNLNNTELFRLKQLLPNLKVKWFPKNNKLKHKEGWFLPALTTIPSDFLSTNLSNTRLNDIELRFLKVELELKELHEAGHELPLKLEREHDILSEIITASQQLDEFLSEQDT